MSAGSLPDRIATVAIVGAGAMGGLYASHFASGGFDVVAAVRGDRARRLAERGLIVNGEPIPLRVFDAASAPAEPPVDLVIVAVKHHHLAAALEDVAPLVGPDTLFLSVLNGLDSEEVIRARFATENVLWCIALAMDAMREGNQVTFRQPGRLVFGEADNTNPSDRVRRVQEALDRAGLAWDTPADMLHEMWWKFMVNVGINQASAVTRGMYGTFQTSPDARELMERLMEEVVTVAGCEGVTLGDADVARWHRVLAGQPADGKTSMLQDVEAGRPTEVEIFAGRVVDLGRKHGVATPFNAAVLHTIRVLAGHGGSGNT
jgi:2-dehydropantoate 2-reductase